MMKKGDVVMKYAPLYETLGTNTGRPYYQGVNFCVHINLKMYYTKNIRNGD